MSFVSAVPGGVRLRIRVQPRASRTEVAGPHGGELRIRLQAPPVDGAANDALIDCLAKFFERPKRGISIVGGPRSRNKRVAIDGLDAAEFAAKLSAILPG